MGQNVNYFLDWCNGEEKKQGRRGGMSLCNGIMRMLTLNLDKQNILAGSPLKSQEGSGINIKGKIFTF